MMLVVAAATMTMTLTMTMTMTQLQFNTDGFFTMSKQTNIRVFGTKDFAYLAHVSLASCMHF